MLTRLHISNYALIDSLDLEPGPGFNVITGETGAGKSIIMGALSLLLGARADARTVRRAADKSVIEAVFTGFGRDEALKALFEANDLEWDPEQIILRREVRVGSASGRSRAFINDTPAPVTRMQEVAMRLVDIHSQHNNRLLADPSFQLQLLDAMAVHPDLLSRYAELYGALRVALRRYKRTKTRLAQTQAEREMITSRLEDLERLAPREGEYAALLQERRLLTDTAALRAAVAEASELINADETGALSRLNRALTPVGLLDEALNEAERLSERLDSLTIELQDISESIEELGSRLDADPGRLEQIEERIDAYETLTRRHGVDSPDALEGVAEDLRSQLREADDAGTTLADLRTAARDARDRAAACAAEITEGRRQAAARFAEALLGEARPPGMPNLAVEIALEPVDLSPTGADGVEFRFAFNKAQRPMPLGGAASGGEISRLMLAVKAVVADRINLPTLILDEIDTGVSGRIAAAMGEMMHRIALTGDTQVIAITHLPQVAAGASTHFKVYKQDTAEATLTHIRRLGREERIDELAGMLSGRPDDTAARAAAISLLDGSVNS